MKKKCRIANESAVETAIANFYCDFCLKHFDSLDNKPCEREPEKLFGTVVNVPEPNPVQNIEMPRKRK